MAICFESQLVGPSSNPAATFSGSANNTELDGTILVAAYLLTDSIPGGGSGSGSGGGGSTSGPIFIGSVTEVSDIEGADIYWGTVAVISEAPSGVPNPYLGKVRVVTAPSGRANPSLGQVVVLGSAPANEQNNWLGSVATS
jgi:hypothetical protein